MPDSSPRVLIALRAYRVCTVATIRGQPPVNHPKQRPPKQPIEPQKTLIASTKPFFLRFFLRLPIIPAGLVEAS